MSLDITFLHLVIMLLTIAVVIGGGIYVARAVKSAEGYSLGGRSASFPLVAGSIAGTVIGGGATVGTAQMASTIGLSAWWFTLSSGITFIVMGFLYAPAWYPAACRASASSAPCLTYPSGRRH